MLQQEHAKNMYIQIHAQYKGKNVHIQIWDENTMIMRLQFLIAMCFFGSSSQFMSVKKQVRGFCESRLGGEPYLGVMHLRP